MKIENIIPITGEYVDIIDNEDNNICYIRYSSDNWLELMGNAWEPVYLDLNELEKLYQEYKGI